MNYIGGKFKLLPQIMPLFPEQTGTFVDLFCGGCNVGINARAAKVIFNDNLSFLVDLYNEFKSKTADFVLNYIEQRIRKYDLSATNEIGYKKLRKSYNENRNPLDLFVLTAYSFNHQIRFNNSHEFNNPFGRERSFYNSKMKQNLSEFLDKIHQNDCVFVCDNFDEFDFSCINENDFVYCDPPYLITTGTYNDGKRGFTGWNKPEEEKLLQILNSINERGIKFALSNVLKHRDRINANLKKWIDDNGYFTTHLKMNYANSNYQIADRSKEITDEVLITNYKPQNKELLPNFDL